jgi:hypothetical protein
MQVGGTEGVKRALARRRRDEEHPKPAGLVHDPVTRTQTRGAASGRPPCGATRAARASKGVVEKANKGVVEKETHGGDA